MKRESVRKTGPLNTTPEPFPSVYDLEHNNNKIITTTNENNNNCNREQILSPEETAPLLPSPVQGSWIHTVYAARKSCIHTLTTSRVHCLHCHGYRSRRSDENRHGGSEVHEETRRAHHGSVPQPVVEPHVHVIHDTVSQ